MSPTLPRHIPGLLLAASVLLCAVPVHAADDVAAWLREADRYRLSQDNLQVETQVTTINRDGSPDKERRYTVFIQADRQSLVLMRSPAEAGQKVLMLGDDFWLLMPGTQRPLRITPTQKLLGDASTGDIATLNWSGDYTPQRVGEAVCEGSTPEVKRPCQHLTLHAARKGLSYARIELWLGHPRHEPLKAELYVQSDKLAKSARFVFDRPESPRTVTEMVLKDQLSNHKATHVRYLSRTPRQVPPAWLNPMFLSRNPSLE